MRGSFDRGRYSFLAPSQSCLYRAGAKTTDKVPLEDQEQDDDRKAAENAHGHYLVPLIVVLAHQQLQPHWDRPHVVRLCQQLPRPSGRVPRVPACQPVYVVVVDSVGVADSWTGVPSPAEFTAVTSK